MQRFDEIIRNFGYLTDGQIQAALEAGFLLDKGTWERKNIRHASYTLRLGGEVHISRASTSGHEPSRVFTISNLTAASRHIHLHPGDTALLYSMERLKMPDSVLGFTVARGLLFAESLCPENTYVDPGFNGTVYTTVTNLSNRVVQLEYGMSVARLFFFRLSHPVANTYQTGHALGIAQQLTSVGSVALGTADECRAATLDELTSAIRQIPIAGTHAAECVDRIIRRQWEAERRLIALALVWPILLVFANSNNWVADKLGWFIANVAVSLAGAGIVYVLPKILAAIGRYR